MNAPDDPRRRRLLTRLVLAASASTLLSGELRASEAPLIAESDAEAKAVKYVEDGSKVKEAMGNRCDTCSLYQGRDGSTQGVCQIFKGQARESRRLVYRLGAADVANGGVSNLMRLVPARGP